MLHMTRLAGGLFLGFAVGGLVLVAGDAEGRERGRKGKRHHFKSAPAPARSRTPATDATGAPADAGTRPVMGGALEGDAVQEVVDRGALLVMSPTRALVLSAYAGLVLVDTSDPTNPVSLATLELEGTAQRMFLGDGEVAVVSDVYDADGVATVVTVVSAAGDALAATGSVRLEGGFRDASRVGDDLLVVTGDGWCGPMPLMGGMRGDVAYAEDGGVKRGRRPQHRPRPQRPRPPRRSMAVPPDGSGTNAWAGGMPDGTRTDDPAGMPVTDIWPFPWWGGDVAHVARVRVGGDGVPALLGTLALDGSLVGSVLSGTDAVLAVQQFPADPWVGVDPRMKLFDAPVEWQPPTTALVRVIDGQDGAPEVAGSHDLGPSAGVVALDRDGDVLRLLGWGGTGQTIATFDLSGGAPAALATFALDGWVESFAFSGGAFAYTTTAWNWTEPSPCDPVFDPDDVARPGDGTVDWNLARGAGDPVTPSDGPTTTLWVVDVRDPSNPAAGGSLGLGAGWTGGLVPVEGGVLGARYVWYAVDGGTSFFRADLTDPAAPSIAAEAAVGEYANLGTVLGDVALVNGGTWTDDGAFAPTVRLADLSGGGLALRGSFACDGWTTAAAREGDLLGLATFDRLTLVDVSDLSNPSVEGTVRFLVNAADVVVLDDSAAAVLVTDWIGGGVEVRTVSLPAADALAPLDTITVGTGDGQLFASPPFVYVVSTDWATGRASVHVVDCSDPTDLRERGSLDLASYPGQVFQKGEALLLLREAWSLFEETADGRMKSTPDPFGPCPRAWLRDELMAVLDVVDLSDPDAPAAGERLRLRWDWAGQAILAGDTLYVPSYVDVPEPDGEYDRVAYGVRAIDVTDPLRPAAGRVVDVPGTLVAATAAAGRVLTVDYQWDETTGLATPTLHHVDLSLPWDERVLASRELDGYPGTVTVGRSHAYVTVEPWGDVWYVAEDAGGFAPPVGRLLTLAVDGLAETGSAERDRGAWGGSIDGGYLFLRTWGWTGAVDVYALADPADPAFVRSLDVAGLAGRIEVSGGRAYVPAGLHGVEVFDLTR